MSNSKELFDSLPIQLKKLIGTPNFDQLTLDKIGSISNLENLVASVKTQTALKMLQPPSIPIPDQVITPNPIILVFCQPS